MSLWGYKRKHAVRTYLGPQAEQKKRLEVPKVKPARKPRKPIRHESKKRASEHKIYSRDRIIFLRDNPFCQREGCKAPSTEIHHHAGRGKNYLNKESWRASCHDCNMFAKDFPAEAIDEGWRAPVGIYVT